MSILAKDFILQASDIATEEVAIPEWGGTVKVRGLSGAERNECEQSVVDADGSSFAAARRPPAESSTPANWPVSPMAWAPRSRPLYRAHPRNSYPRRIGH
jgi:hypothetical protein